MRSLSRLFLPISTLFLTAVFLGTFAKPVAADSTGFLSLINSYRQQNNLGTLSEDQNLTNAACWFAADMGAKNYFPSDHVDSQGRTMSQRLSDFGVSGGSRGENIFYTTAGSSANYAFDAWKNSSGHNANMLNSSFTRIGIGRVYGSGKWYWVTDFASGTAAALSNQCGTANSTPPPPPPTSTNKSSKKTQTNTQPTSDTAQPVTITETVEVQTSTPSANPQNKVVGSKSATLSAKKIKMNYPTLEQARPTLVQGVAATSLLMGNLVLCSFLVLKLFRFHR